MLRNFIKFKFCFRFRREWQLIYKGEKTALEKFCQQVSAIDNKLTLPEKIKFYDLIDQKKKIIKQLVEGSPINTSFENSVINWHLFQLKNKRLEQKLETQGFTLEEIYQQMHALYTSINQYFTLLQQYLQNKLLVDRIKRRFSILQQAIAIVAIQNYKEKKENSPFEINKTKFKEDSQYSISQLSSKDLQTLSKIMFINANFHQFSKKMMLLCQMITQKYHTSMGNQLSTFLFIMAHSKTGLKAINSHLQQRYLQSVIQDPNHCIYALYYFIVNQFDNYQLISRLVKRFNELKIDCGNLNINQVRLVYYLSKWLSVSKQNYPVLNLSSSDEEVIKSRILQFYSVIGSQQQFFKRFITKQQFKFHEKIDEFFLKPAYIMSTNVFFFVDHRDIGTNSQQTGLQYLGKDYYKAESVKIKSINASQTSKAETRRKQVQYFWSKLKKQSRATKSQKPLYYEF